MTCPQEAAQELIEATVAMHEDGLPLMLRLLPADAPAEQWAHYPADDAVSPVSGARYFYHCHPPEERGADEHGHFHLFLPLSLFDRKQALSAPPEDGARRAEVVHFAALSVNNAGVPVELFTVNRWVTDEWLFSVDAIVERLGAFDLDGADGDALVNRWLTSFVVLARQEIAALLAARDALLAARGWPGEERAVEVTSRATIDLQQLVERALPPEDR